MIKSDMVTLVWQMLEVICKFFLGKDNLVATPVETASQQVHQRKQWSMELKNLFFEGLFEVIFSSAMCTGVSL